MIGGLKDMIAGCIERMRDHSCGTCERREACAFVWPEALGHVFSLRRDRGSPKRRGVLSLLLGEIAKAVESEMKARDDTLRRKVERHLEPLLASGPVRIDRVARDMGFSRQTLHRRLGPPDLLSANRGMTI